MKKTKKALLAALACSAALAGAVGLAACSGDKDTHDHVWGNWTVSTQPTTEATGKATRACTGEGTCDAAATEKEATLPVLTSTDYTKGEDTATCQAAGTVTYTYNKGGVNVSFNVATPINADKHTDNCGHQTPTPTPTPTAHSHVWSEWDVNESAKNGYAGEATRTCSGAGTCDADESLTVVTIPSALWGDEYVYDAPVHKTKANCQTEGVDTYTYKDAANDISVSFDVKTGYGDHSVVNDECEICHKTAVAAVLDDEVTVNATSEKATILVFTAETAGKYRFILTEGGIINVNDYTAEFPAMVELEAGEKVFYDIKAPVNPVEPEETVSLTYKIKVVPVTVLKAEYDAQDNLVGSATVNTGAGKTAYLEVRGKVGFDGTITYTGTNSLTFTYYVYSYDISDYIPYSFTLSENEPSYTVGFSISSVFEIYEVTSDAEDAFDAELSITLEEQVEDLSIMLDVDKTFEGVGYDGKVYSFEIGEGGAYTVDVRGLDVLDGKVYFEVRSDADDGESVITANADGSYTFASDTTYYLLVAANEGEYTVEGVITISAYVATPTLELNEEATGYMDDVYEIYLEAGNYQVLVDGDPVGIDISNFNNVIWISDGDNYLTDVDTVITITVAGTYRVEIYDYVTFKIVAA